MARQDGELVEIEILAPVRAEGEAHKLVTVIDGDPDQLVAKATAQAVFGNRLSRLAERAEVDQPGAPEEGRRGQVDILKFPDFVPASGPHAILRSGFGD